MWSTFFFLIFSSLHVTLFKYFSQYCLLAGLYWGWGGWGERESEVGRERVEIIAMMTSPAGILMWRHYQDTNASQRERERERVVRVQTLFNFKSWERGRDTWKLIAWLEAQFFLHDDVELLHYSHKKLLSIFYFIFQVKICSCLLKEQQSYRRNSLNVTFS